MYAIDQTLGLSDDQIRHVAPSVFATHAAAGVSDRYAFIPTYPLVRQMRTLGFQPVKVREGFKRAPEGRQFAFHEVRFQRVQDRHWANETRELGQLIPEVLLRGSHDRTSGFEFSAGIQRLVCLNGMTAMESDFQFRIRHAGRNVMDQVHEAANSIVGNAHKIIDVAKEWQKIGMSLELQRRFAEGALKVRGTAVEPLDPSRILMYRRMEDAPETLWNVFNRAQENLTRGLLTRDVQHRYTKLQGIKTLKADVDFNRKLWTFASQFAAEHASDGSASETAEA